MKTRCCALAFGLLAAVATRGAEVELNFSPVFDTEPLRLDSLRYAAGAGGSLSVTRLSLLLSSFALEREDGTWVENENRFAFLDLGTRRLSHRLERVPAGAYRAMRFTVGLDPTTNASDPASYPPDHPLNPTLNNLHWAWQGGYIFLALEGRRRQPDEVLDAWSLHFARDPNRTVVTLPLSLELTGRTSAVGLELDLAVLMQASEGTPLLNLGNSTHSRDGDPIAAALRETLPRAFRARVLAGGPSTVPAPTASGTPASRAGGDAQLPSSSTPYPFRMSASLPVPELPRDNPLTVERVALGRRLFQEPLLSRTGTLSCASCHEAAHAFSDPRPRSRGVNGDEGARHAMPLFNLAWKSSFFWDGRAPSLREQALGPITDHREMDESLDRVVAKLEAHPDYPTLFATAFEDSGITPARLGLALENFLLTLVSDQSRFDRAMRGEESLEADELRGFELFFTEFDPRTRQFGADCFHCHGGALFSDHQFHDNGLADPKDPGRAAVTGRDGDRGKFATPSLRNIALTAPYMHDGRFATLDEVVAHYVTGVQPGSGLDPNLAKHPGGRVPLSPADQRALVAFLKTLSDPTLENRGER